MAKAPKYLLTLTRADSDGCVTAKLTRDGRASAVYEAQARDALDVSSTRPSGLHAAKRCLNGVGAILLSDGTVSIETSKTGRRRAVDLVVLRASGTMMPLALIFNGDQNAPPRSSELAARVEAQS